MTRETKVGLVVATSFVCLVGVVVASRLAHKGELPANELIAQANSPNNGKGSAEPPKKPLEAPPKHVPEKPLLPIPQALAAAPETFNKPNHANSSVEQLSPPGLPAPLAPPPMVQAQTAAPHIENPLEQNKEHNKASHNGAAHADPDEKVRELLAKAQQGADKHSKETGALGPKITPPPAPAPLPMVSMDPVVPASLTNSAPPVGVGAKDELNGVPPPYPLSNVTGLGQTEEGAKANLKAPPNEKPAAKGGVGAHKEEQTPLSPPPAIDLTPPPPPALPPPAPKQVAPAPKPALVNQSPKEEPTPAVSGLTAAPVANRPNKENDPISVKKDANFTGQPANNPAPRVVSKATSSQVKVRDYDFPVHTCTAQDVSFESLSTMLYGSPTYAKALLQFNRDYPPVGATLTEENPRLQMNQKVVIPPKETLESRFPRLIGTGSTALASAVVPAISLEPPPNATLPKQVPGSAPRPAPSTDATKAYRVPAQGQMIIEIAQQTLGDRGRWSEIYRLNPALRPEFPIPGGTEIRLPATAVAP